MPKEEVQAAMSFTVLEEELQKSSPTDKSFPTRKKSVKHGFSIA
jgi:hypothetical protein